MNKVAFYEEKTIYMDNIPFYGDVVKIEKIKKHKTDRQYDYVTEAINEAFKTFVKADKNKVLFKNNSRYFYDDKSINILFQLLQEENLQHEIGFRNISKDIKHPCYEINFKEVLNRTKPEEY